MKADKTNKFAELYTPEGEELVRKGGTVPWQGYPRPQMKRDSFVCLNGEWDFFACEPSNAAQPELISRIFAAACGEDETRKFDPELGYGEKISVPFVPQSLLSGINRSFPEGTVYCYRKFIEYTKQKSNSRILLHVGGADRDTLVVINGMTVGCHSGGYESFSFDVTDFLTEKSELKIFVADDHVSCIYPYGKQREKRGGMWYTPISGIWQTVWLEEIPDTYITEVSAVGDLDGAYITVDTNRGAPTDGELIFYENGKETRIKIDGGRARIEPTDPVHWTPENPHLYYFSVKIGDDEVESYFALRTLTVESGKRGHVICLNGKPYFFHGLLDQGYFSDGIFLPASPEGYERDILKAKELGFNMLRKHIKVEPEVFYYDCDRLGMVVFQDMVNCGKYSFLRDTALPTIGFKRKNDKNSHKNPEVRREFIKCMEMTVRRLGKHPSVCYWTVFNEGWGQFDHAYLYRRLKELDSTRPIDSVSGWFTSPKGTVSDVESIHVYFKKIKLPKADRPIILSEFGGYSYRIEGHSFNLSGNYGYGSYSSAEEFEKAFLSLYNEQVIPAIKEGLCGAVYTQLSDVEDETNGLMTYDRRVTKVSAEKMTELGEKLRREFLEDSL